MMYRARKVLSLKKKKPKKKQKKRLNVPYRNIDMGALLPNMRRPTFKVRKDVWAMMTQEIRQEMERRYRVELIESG
jgi:hypothetical protein